LELDPARVEACVDAGAAAGAAAVARARALIAAGRA
jgi:hypothetical protein